MAQGVGSVQPRTNRFAAPMNVSNPPLLDTPSPDDTTKATRELRATCCLLFIFTAQAADTRGGAGVCSGGRRCAASSNKMARGFSSTATVIDRIVPRRKFGSSVFGTISLLALRLFFQAAPLDHATPPVTSAAYPGTGGVKVGEGITAGEKLDAKRKLITAVNEKTGQVLDLTRQTSPAAFCHLLDDQQYPINTFSQLRAVTWIHSLSSPLSHEFLSAIIQCPHSGNTHRLIIERDTKHDHVHICSASIRPGEMITVCEDDEHHALPLPLLSLDWSEVKASKRPTALDLADIMMSISRRQPGYNLMKHHCWWFAEAVFEELLEKFKGEGETDTDRSHQHSILKHWPSAAYRYSYIVVTSYIKREKLIQEAKRFGVLRNEGGVLRW